MKSLRYLVIGLFCACVPSLSVADFDLGQWINPGPLSAPHEHLEGVKNCQQCHATAKGVPDRKCLTCHVEIQERLNEKKGYHARQAQECFACHSEHKGKSYDETGLSRLTFQHDDTGWPLTGAHTKPKCVECHKQTRIRKDTSKDTGKPTYLGAKAECASCHKDPHSARKNEFKACERCHTTDLWKTVKPRMGFTHNRDTRYPLTGAHAKVRCYACHKEKIWAPIAFDKCTNCHADPHKGKFGDTCTKCHNTTAWKGASPTGKGTFDHDKTAFPLRGEHIGVSCAACHGPTIGKIAKFQECSDCHNNPHGNQFETLWTVKKTCSSCHIDDGWQVLKFQHNTDSRYKLEDKHALVPCNQCHMDRKYRWLSSSPDCVVCHKDVHRGQFKQICADCHTTKGFNELRFDHGKTRFPLVGKHQFVQCSNCHQEGRFRGIETNCQGCHNDFHVGELGNECRRCHAPMAFNDIEFDHNREARFKLDGLHVKVPCTQCHANFKFKLTQMNCSNCHLDVHNGGFGSACERCHTTSGFSVKTGFHDFGEYSLGGAHDRLDCLTCHGPKSAVRTNSVDCASCHKDPHMNSMGRNCNQCHGQSSWLPTTFRHNQTGFELSGAHRFLSCDRCHFNRVFGGLPQECSFCHSKDFVPTLPQHVSAPPTCDSCHFTYGWKPSKI